MVLCLDGMTSEYFGDGGSVPLTADSGGVTLTGVTTASGDSGGVTLKDEL